MNRIPKIILYSFIYLVIGNAIIFAAQFKCTRVTDGDTIKGTNNDTVTTIRLVGIDAPELFKKKNEPGQPYSQKSTKHLVSLS